MAIDINGKLNLELGNLSAIEKSLGESLGKVNKNFANVFLSNFGSGTNKLVDFATQLNNIAKAGGNTVTALSVLNNAFNILGKTTTNDFSKSVGNIVSKITDLKAAIAGLGTKSGSVQEIKAIKDQLVGFGVEVAEVNGLIRDFKLEAVNTQLDNYAKHLKDTAVAQEEFAKRLSQQKKLEAERATTSGRQNFISGIEARGGGVVLGAIQKEIEAKAKLADFDKRLAAQQDIQDQRENRRAIDRSRNNFIQGIEGRGGGAVLGVIQKQLDEQKQSANDAAERDRLVNRFRKGRGTLEARDESAANKAELEQLLGQFRTARDFTQRQEAQRRIVASGQNRSFSGEKPLSQAEIDRRALTGGIEARAASAAAAEKAAKQQEALNKQLEAGKFSAFKFGEQIGLAFKRFSAFVIGASPIYFVINALRNATKEALAFEHQMTKIEQVLDIPTTKVAEIAESIKKAAVSTGSPINQIAEGVQTFAQAGFKDPRELEQVAKELAKIPLTATFGDIKSTVEGTLAVFGQFNLGLKDTAEIFDTVNQFAADFAVESKDIFEAVKRGGAAFSTAGGSLKEFITLFSLLRSATREEPAALGNFIKVSINDLLTPKSQGILANKGVKSKNPTQQILEFAPIFGKLTENDQLRTAQELVGSRQSNRLVTVLRELNKDDNIQRVQKALSELDGSIDRSISKRLDDIGVSFDRVREAFNSFVTSISQDTNLKKIIEQVASLTVGFIGATKAIAPLIPLVASLGALFAASKLKEVFAGAASKFGLNNLGSSTQLQNGVLTKNSFASRALDFIQPRIGFGAALAGSVIGSNLASSGESVGSRATGATISGGSNGGLVAAALGFGPLGITVGVVGGALHSLTSSLEESRQAIFEEIKARNGSIEDLIKAKKDNPVGLGSRLEQGLKTGIGIISENLTTNPFRDTLSGKSKRNFQRANSDGKDLFSTGIFQSDEQEDLVKTIFSEANKQAKTALQKGIDTNPEKFKGANLDRELTVRTIKNALPLLQQAGINTNFFEAAGALGSLRQRGAVGNNKIDDFQRQLNRKLPDASQLQFQEKADALFALFTKFADALSDTFIKLNRKSDALARVITDDKGLVKLTVPSNTSDALRFGGFGGLAAKNDQVNNFTSVLSRVFGNQLNLSTLRGFGQNVKDIGGTTKAEREVKPEDLIKQLAPAASNDERKQLQDIFSNLAAAANEKFGDVVDEFSKSADPKKLVESKLGVDNGAVAGALEVTKQRIELFNREREITKTLNDQIRSLNSSIYETKTRVQEFGDELKERLQASLEFNSRSEGSVGALQARAGLSSDIAGRSNFGNQDTFIQSILQASEAKNAALNGSNNTAISAREADAAQESFANLRQELDQRVNELSKRLASTAQATDILRKAFTDLKGQVSSAGAGVSGTSVRDLAFGFQSFKQFQQGGLNSLLPNQFEALQKTLTTAGNFTLGKDKQGKNITGTNILEDINTQLGIPFLANLSRQLPGNQNLTQDQAEKQITDQIKDAKDKANKANAEESDLRGKQSRLVELQTKLAQDGIEFYKGQKNLTDILAKLPDNSQNLQNIDKNVAALLGIISANGGAGNPVASTLDVKPIQVNVALNAPDIANTAVPLVYAKVMEKIGASIGDALGIVSEEAASRFKAGIVTT